MPSVLTIEDLLSQSVAAQQAFVNDQNQINLALATGTLRQLIEARAGEANVKRSPISPTAKDG